jgi:TonB family protein
LQSRPDVAFTARLTVKVKVRDGAVLSARVIRSSGAAMADNAVIEWIKNRWRFQTTAQGRQIFEFYINVDPSPKAAGYRSYQQRVGERS